MGTGLGAWPSWEGSMEGTRIGLAYSAAMVRRPCPNPQFCSCRTGPSSWTSTSTPPGQGAGCVSPLYTHSTCCQNQSRQSLGLTVTLRVP